MKIERGNLFKVENHKKRSVNLPKFKEIYDSKRDFMIDV